MTNQDYVRTKYEALLDADYGVRVHELHARFFKRLRWAIAFVQVVAATAAAAPLVSLGDPKYIPAIGVFLALLTVTDAISDFAGARHQHLSLKSAYADVRVEAQAKSLAQIDADLARLEKIDSTIIEGLRMPAYNDVVRRHGRIDWVKPVNAWQRLVAALA